MNIRGHQPITISEFNGLWSRDANENNNADSTPLDHFTDCNNIQFTQGGFKTRDGINTFVAIPNIVRMYTFNQETGQSILALDSSGNIYDSGSPTPTTPILTVSGMTDFAFVPFAGRAYLSPHNGVKGLANEFVYVYEGDGSVARKAAGAGPVIAEGALAAANSATAGNVEAGYHAFGAVYETDTGFLTNIGPIDALPFVNADGTKKVDISGIPNPVSADVVKIHIVATKAVNPLLWTGNPEQYEFFFVPDGEVNPGTSTLTVNFYDADLIDSADELFDLFDEIPAGAVLGTYHNRLIVAATDSDISLAYVSNPGEPEAINQVDGLLIFPLDGNPITNAQEFRDILYLTKQTRTNAWSDNGDVPSSWPMTVLDQGIGASLHGIATVLDSGGVNVDYLIIASYTGLMLFSGNYINPELSWKIKAFWDSLDRDLFNKIQLLNNTVAKVLYCLLPDGRILLGDWKNGLTPKDIRWAPLSFSIDITTITLIDTETLILGANEE